MRTEFSPSAGRRGLAAQEMAFEPRVGVLLNANARQVDERTIRALSHVLTSEDIYISRSPVDSRRIAQRVLERGYDTLFLGGGDGTFVGFANEIVRLQKRHPGRLLPRFGMLKLGTGNGLAAYLHASPRRGNGILDDVLRAKSGEARSRRLDLLSVDSTRCPFAGLGADAQLLNDYAWVKSTLGKGITKNLFNGGGGYLSAVALKTVPHYLTHSTSVECEVVNSSNGPAFRLGPDGRHTAEIAPGEVVFRGKAMMAAAGTIPFYGFAFRIFPFAGSKPGMMHFRVGALSTPSILANLPKLWNGRWFPAGIHDFQMRGATIRFAQPMPLQIAGDAAGYRDEVRMDVAPESLEMVDFSRPVN